MNLDSLILKIKFLESKGHYQKADALKTLLQEIKDKEKNENNNDNNNNKRSN